MCVYMQNINNNKAPSHSYFLLLLSLFSLLRVELPRLELRFCIEFACLLFYSLSLCLSVL